jgi:hypothetical protein
MTSPDCAVLDYPPGPVTGPRAVAGMPCDLPADFIITASCECGHPSRQPMCEDHAKGIDGEGLCLTCLASGHRCDLAVKLKEYLP